MKASGKAQPRRRAERPDGGNEHTGDGMTPLRYLMCLDAMGLSLSGLAPLLGCPYRLPRAWAAGKESIPPKVAEWLEECLALRRAHPDPKPPLDWRPLRGAPPTPEPKRAREALKPLARAKARRLAIAAAKAKERARLAEKRRVLRLEEQANYHRALQARRETAKEDRRNRDAMIVAARCRGITLRDIGTRLGLTHERVRQILVAHDAPAVARRPRGRPATRVAVVCAACGKASWRRRSEVAAGPMYCSRACVIAARLKVTDVQAVLALRAEGISWAAAARRLGASVQSVQIAVWHLLAATGQLTTDVVEPLWRTRRQPPKWRWLEESTGHLLTAAPATPP
jgi:hypothetical protein